MAQTTTFPEPLMQTDLPLTGRRQGKVRDIYECTLDNGTEALVIIATDRISAFDVVMPNGVPGKGIVLTKISKFWFDMVAERLADRIRHHLISTEPTVIPGLSDNQIQSLRGRVMIGSRTKVVPIECVVRGYLAGSGWKEYKKSQSVCGLGLPAGLRQCAKLSQPVFTPSTKAETGHDENLSFAQVVDTIGAELATTLRDISLAIYQMGHDYAAERGVILADTKFEFGHTEDGRLLLIDEVLTPDSSRFWPADDYEAGRDQDSYDKQYVRNHLETIVEDGHWDKTPPGPTLPDGVVRGTMDKYAQIYRTLTGQQVNL